MLTTHGEQLVVIKNVGRRRRRGASFIVWAAAVSVVSAGLLWAAHGSGEVEPLVANGQATPIPVATSTPSDTTTQTGPPDDGLRDLVHVPAPEGMEGILDRYGRVVGYVDSHDLSIAGGEPPMLGLAGRQTTLQGLAVIDNAGAQVGWFMVGVGFYSLAETDEPAEVEAIEDHKAELDRLSIEHAGPNGENLPPPVNEDGTPVGGG